MYFRISYIFLFFSRKEMNDGNSTIIVDTNPWQVDSIQDFLCFKCPECVFNSKEESCFQKHAINCHPLSFVLFGEEDKEIVCELKDNYDYIIDDSSYNETFNKISELWENSNTSCPEETSEEMFENEYKEVIFEFSDVNQKIADEKNENDNNYETLNKNSKLSENSTRFHEETSKENLENEHMQLIMKFEDVDDKNPEKESFDIAKESKKQKDIILKENDRNKYNYETKISKKSGMCSVNICGNKKSNSNKNVFHFPQGYRDRYNLIDSQHKKKNCDVF